jgi:TolB-like protein/Tfp pilus assembly protein PilF
MTPTPAAPSGAVFLSYASQDADPAQRLCDSLRAAGIEVWFDRRALAGGDAWDGKIRGQISTCALFIPIISANTQARLEGYFRLEWKLAAQRTHAMAEAKPFLLPVVIDATRDADAHVPAEFKAVQWTRLPAGETTEAFCARVKKLLGAEVAQASPPADPPHAGETPALRPNPDRSIITFVWPAAALVAIGATIFLWQRLAQVTPSPKPVAAGSSEPNSTVPRPAILNDKSIAVLPFDNLSTDPENAFVAIGIHAEVLANLQNIRELRVISLQSVAAYRGTTKKTPEIARELGVSYLLTGSVQRAADTVRVAAQLVDARTDTNIWSPQPYTKKLTNVFAIQSEIAGAIAEALRTTLSPQEKSLVARHPTNNAEAYELYLKTRDANADAFFRRQTLERNEGLLRAAVALDPKFAAAWADLAVCHSLLYYHNFDHTESRRAQAQSAIDAAVALAPDSPHVVRALGSYYLHAQRDYAKATAQFEVVARAQPNDPTTAAALGHAQQQQGRWADSHASLRKATQLDPANLGFSTSLIRLLYAGRRWDDCEAEGRRMLARQPQAFELGYWTSFISFTRSGSTGPTDAFFAALTPEQAALPGNLTAKKFWLLLRGDYDGAIRLTQAHPFDPAQTQEEWSIITGTAFAHAAQGDLPGAQKLVADLAPIYRRRLAEEPGNTDVLWILGLIEAVLGRKDEALRLARSAVEAVPADIDAVSYAASLNRLVVIYAWAGEKDRAIAEAARMLRMPFTGVSVQMMKRDPFWFPLRGDPRFEAVLNDPKNNAPLF